MTDRAPVIKRYLHQVPGARPHIPIDRHAPTAAFAAVADRCPVFVVSWLPQASSDHRRQIGWATDL